MQKHRNVTSLLVLVLIVSMSCRLFIQDEAPATPVTPPDSTKPPTPTLPIPTATPPAPTSTSTGTPAPSRLNERGPYVLYAGTDGIWISNPDGSFLTKLTDVRIEGVVDLYRLVSPAGDRMALAVRTDEGLDLVEVRIPGGETKTITHLLSITPEELISYPTSVKAITSYAISNYNNVTWQPGDGRLLAFMGGMNGPTSDLYVYDTQTDEITQLTSGLTQAVFPNWSPDGKYILHYGVSWRGPFGGAILGHDHLDGVWAVQVADGQVIRLPTPKSVALDFVGWQDNTHYITYASNDECNSQNLVSVDVVTGEATALTGLSFYSYIARSPENGAILFSGGAGCPNSPGEGIFLLQPGETTPIKLADKKAWEINWIPESNVFDAYPEALFSSDGKVRYDPPLYDKSFQPAVSQKGYQAWEVIENFEGRVEVKVPGADWRTILAGSVADLIWDPVFSETLLIIQEDGSLYAASYPDFTPRRMGNVGHFSRAIWLP